MKQDHARPPAEREALQRFLKTLANSTSYGVFVELNPRDDDPRAVRVYGRESFDASVTRYEEPGRLFFPPLATLITGAARLMLALAETAVRERGGCYTFMDTDSLAIVASERGGLIPCPGGDLRLPDGREAIRALSWTDVDAIIARFTALNPYGDDASILTPHDENLARCGITDHAPDCTCTTTRRDLSCYAIAAKRYVLFNRAGRDLIIRKASEHALGNYLPPRDPATGAPVADWIALAWTAIVRAQVDRLPFTLPAWAAQPSTTRLPISTPAMLHWFTRWNASDPHHPAGPQKPYAEQVKPFNFLQHVTRLPRSLPPRGLPPNTPLHLIAPYGENERWGNLHDPAGPTYGVQTDNSVSGLPERVVVWSYRQRIARHHLKDEAKSLGPDGRPAGGFTQGLLRRPAHAGLPPPYRQGGQ